MRSHGPLPWQLAVNLRRNANLGLGPGNTSTVLSLPPDEPVDRLRERLAGMVERQDVLRITELPHDGRGPVTYAAEIDLPLRTAHADSAEEAGALMAELRTQTFRYDLDAPLWIVEAIEHPDRDGRPSRTAIGVLDHHISDGPSSLLFKEMAGGGSTGSPVARRGTYQEWVSRQLEQFPMVNPAGVATPARDFWRRYFDGGAPNRATVLPFCTPDAPLCGLEQITFHDLPIRTADLQHAAGTLACSPFLLVMASVAAAVGELTGEDDLTMRYVSHGRTPPVVDTLGWFSDHVPLRIRTGSLADPWQALPAARSARLALVEHEVTPWGYILGVCQATDPEQPQIVLNFLPRLDPPPYVPRPTDRTIPGRRGYLNLTVGLPRTGTGRLECRFDPKRFAKDGVDRFVQLVLDVLKRLIAGAATRGSLR